MKAARAALLFITKLTENMYGRMCSLINMVPRSHIAEHAYKSLYTLQCTKSWCRVAGIWTQMVLIEHNLLYFTCIHIFGVIANFKAEDQMFSRNFLCVCFIPRMSIGPVIVIVLHAAPEFSRRQRNAGRGGGRKAAGNP